MVYPYNRILFDNKKEWNTDPWYNMGGVQKHHAKWQKPVTKDHKLNDSVHMKCPE